MTTRTGELVLTTGDVDRAAATVAAIATISPMDRGFVRFNDDLTGGYWSWEDRPGDGCVIVRMPLRFDPGSCRQAVLDGLEEVRYRVRRQLAADGRSSRAPDWRRRLSALQFEIVE